MPVSYRLLESGTIRLLESGSSLLTEASAASVAAASSGSGSASGSVDAALFPDLVYLLPLSESPDDDAGPEESFPSPTGPGLPCVVECKKVARMKYAGEQEVGVTPLDVAFPSDPGARKGDRLLWVGRVIRALAPARPQAGLYYLDGEIRD